MIGHLRSYTLRSLNRGGLRAGWRSISVVGPLLDSNAGAPTSDPSSPAHPDPSARFHRTADMYLGGIWNRMEAELRGREGDEYEYDVQFTHGCLTLNLPDSSSIKVCKLPERQALQVETTLHDMTKDRTDDPDPREANAFALDEEGNFVDVGQRPLHEFLENTLARHLQVEIDLEPQQGPHDKVYGADPT